MEQFSNIEKEDKQISENPLCTIENELKLYYGEKVLPANKCILEWWQENSARLPNLAIVAQNVLGIPASQAYSERLFSTAGNIVTYKRASLLCEKVEQICYLSANLRASV